MFGWFSKKYVNDPEAVIVSCFFNPTNSPYRLKVFNQFYDKIKHLNHAIIECVIGEGEPQLGKKATKVVRTPNLLWHKEALLNNVIAILPKKFKYVFWVDADVLFTNLNWLRDGVEQLKNCNIIQPFEYCYHLEKDETKPSNADPAARRKWRSFCSNFNTKEFQSDNYDVHGHVGFAWGIRREILDQMPLYDKALIGGADHIMAHAAAGQIPHSCITKSFTADIDAVNEWSRNFYKLVQGKIGYVKGDLYHLWHGDIAKRNYLKRIQDFTAVTKNIKEKDSNGLYVAKADSPYMKKYFNDREVADDGFLASAMIGYATDNAALGGLLGGNMVGGMVGEMLNPSPDAATHHHDETISDQPISVPDQQPQTVDPEPVEPEFSTPEQFEEAAATFS